MSATRVGERRNRRQRLLDRGLTRIGHLPPAICDYTVERNHEIPMRDGAVLLADLLVPQGPSFGTVMIRSPYGFGSFSTAIHGGTFASRGFHVLLSRCRGTFGSGGDFEPAQNETADGHDTVAWLREQAWFDGRLATYGGSYVGFTQWALLMDPPPELRTAVISIAPHDFHQAVYQDGAFGLMAFLSWAYQVGHQEDGGFWHRAVDQITSLRKIGHAVNELPLVDGATRLLDGRSSWYLEWVARRDADDPLWAAPNLTGALEKVNVPVLLQTGWQDFLLNQTMHQYQRLTERQVPVALTVGPWNHTQIQTQGGAKVTNEALTWMRDHLGGRPHGRIKPVEVFVTGADTWKSFAAWPPATTNRVLHPVSGSRLTDEADEGRGSVEFVYDPADPTPTVGGPLLVQGGYVDDSKLAARSDVVTFDTGPLEAPLEVHGRPIVRLNHLSDNRHADVFVRLSQVDANGRSRNVTEGFVRLRDADSERVVTIELDPVAHVFKPGTKVRLLVAGGTHPRRERNLGTDGDPATSSHLVPSRRSIALRGSDLTLPILD